MSVDPERLEATVAALSRLIRAHAGGLELVDVDDVAGIVTVRYTGMCRGCELRPVTTEGSVRPALLEVPGVTAVRVAGMRISAEAEARMARDLAPYGVRERAVRLTQQPVSVRHEVQR